MILIKLRRVQRFPVENRSIQPASSCKIHPVWPICAAAFRHRCPWKAPSESPDPIKTIAPGLARRAYASKNSRHASAMCVRCRQKTRLRGACLNKRFSRTYGCSMHSSRSFPVPHVDQVPRQVHELPHSIHMFSQGYMAITS
jgi:hypothetical protein